MAPLITVHHITVSCGMLSLDNISSNVCPWAVCAQLPGGELCSRLFALRQHGLPKDHCPCVSIVLVLATTQVLKTLVSNRNTERLSKNIPAGCGGAHSVEGAKLP